MKGKGMSDIHAEQIIYDLGISRPKDIDLDAIALTLGVKVNYEPLADCEALIVGHGESAIATINSRSMPERQRFSLGHELGHWTYHKGHMLYCTQDDIEGRSDKVRETEAVADRFASSLLMPSFLFKPALSAHKKLSWRAVRELASEFECSPLATALRIVDLNVAPVIFVCVEKGKRRWFRRARDISTAWFPKDSPDPESYAFELSFDPNKAAAGPRKVGADAWFDRYNADRFDLVEDSVRVVDSVYSLLVLEDEAFLN
jgi:Zn-dependent peptidase ImmA (M78 family)